MDQVGIIRNALKISHGSSLEIYSLSAIFFQSIGVVSHVTLPSHQVESDAAPALTAVGKAGKETSKGR